MRYAFLLLCLTTTAFAQTADKPRGTDLAGGWVGPLELTVTHPDPKRGPIPTVVELRQTGNTIEGDWRTLHPNTMSGTIKGTVNDKGAVRVTVTMNVGVLGGDPERCIGFGQFSGGITASGILRVNAKEMHFDLPGVVAQNRGCDNTARDFVWTLQRH